jgi:23S rRNA-/tRNA-specific pseudouridylate synthase
MRYDMQLSGVIEEPIARDNQSIITRKVDASGKYAKTSYETVNTFYLLHSSSLNDGYAHA